MSRAEKRGVHKAVLDRFYSEEDRCNSLQSEVNEVFKTANTDSKRFGEIGLVKHNDNSKIMFVINSKHEGGHKTSIIGPQPIEIIRKAFSNDERQYLTGDLSMPQILEYIKDENVEVGISRCKDYKIENPHYHTEVSEYHLIIKGQTKYVNITENKEYIFGEGDFYIIRPNTIYIQKSLKGTELIFIKVPGMNDKVKCEVTDRIKTWFEDWNNKWN